MRRKPYPGVLNRPIRLERTHRIATILSGEIEDSPAWLETYRAEITPQLEERLEALFQYFGIRKSDGQLIERPWETLALALAEQHVKGFQIASSHAAGRKRGNRDLNPHEVYSAVLARIKLHRGKSKSRMSVLEACRRLSSEAGPLKGKKAETIRRVYVEAKKAKSLRLRHNSAMAALNLRRISYFMLGRDSPILWGSVHRAMHRPLRRRRKKV